MRAKIKTEPKRILDFDIETIAAGFADPQWVPQDVTCIAWSWIGEDKIRVATRLDAGPREMLDAFLGAYEQADMVTGHNLIRFDLPVLNAEYLRFGFPSLGAKLVQDTMKIVKTKGFKKGQDNLETLLELPSKKLPLNHQEWRNAYLEPGWKTVIARCTGDVAGHKLLRAEMIERGMLKPPTLWKP